VKKKQQTSSPELLDVGSSEEELDSNSARIIHSTPKTHKAGKDTSKGTPVNFVK
jgi:hypothetical protein